MTFPTALRQTCWFSGGEIGVVSSWRHVRSRVLFSLTLTVWYTHIRITFFLYWKMRVWQSWCFLSHVHPQEIQSLLINWKGPDLTTYGELVLEGTFHVLRAKNTRTLFLFEKMLLITKKRGEHYVYKIHILVCLLDLFFKINRCLLSLLKNNRFIDTSVHEYLCLPPVISVLHPNATRQCEGSPALQRHPFQASQAAAHSAGTWHSHSTGGFNGACGYLGSSVRQMGFIFSLICHHGNLTESLT